ncbi:MAG: esterase family protein [Oligoflexia bacterium]|nr:esterase family protein [Oligoflexia bacterium]
MLPFVGKDFLRGGRGGNDADHGRYFMEEVIAAAEAGSGTSDSSRWIGGLSMGGMAALSVFLRHPARFCGVGAHFPTLVDFDFHNDSEVQGYARANGVPDGYRDLLISDLRAAFPSLGFFRENDPIALARALPEKALAGKTLCLDVGSGDEFGLHAGARVFHELLERRGIPHAFEVVEGGKHDAPFLVQRFPLLLDALLG